MISLNLAVIPGDGIGPEVICEALETLEIVAKGTIDVQVTSYPLGATHFLETGETLSDETLMRLSAHDVILLGAVGGRAQDPKLQGGVVERGLLLRLRFAFDQYVNLRPTVLLPGMLSPLSNPGVVDFVVIREGTEGPYVGNGGTLRAGTPDEVATEVSVNTARGVSRVVRFAFEKASARRKKLTLVHKSNVLVHAGSLWTRLVREIHRDYPDVDVDYLHIDAATIFLVTNPSRFDVVVTDNLFGDIITDLAATVGGGIGMAASANLNPSGEFPSMFEPVHGSAPDIAGTGQADPTACILSVALLLEHRGFPELAHTIVGAVAADLTRRDAHEARTTSEIGSAIRSGL